MHFLINLIVFFGLMDLNNGQKSSSQSFLLTDDHDGMNTIQFDALTQCHATNGTDQNTKKNYGIAFHLPLEGGHCDDGLLICYPATLQRGHDLENTFTTFKLKKRFIINDQKNNPIAKECAEIMAKYGHSNYSPTHWRGIKLRTVPMPSSSAPNVTQMSPFTILLEVSIASKISYKFEAIERHFSLIFDGDETRINLAKNEMPLFAAHEHAIKNEFWHNCSPKGVLFLADYAALWFLGLDMLPMPHQQQQQKKKMKLFLSRGCKCTMEASFFQPSGSVVPLVPKMPSADSAKFPPKYIEQCFPIKLIKKDKQMISIKALSIANPKNIIIELLSAKKCVNTKTEVSFKLGTNIDLEVALPGKLIRGKEVRLPNGTTCVNLDIVLTKRCYALRLDGTLFGGLFCPTGGKVPREPINRIKVQGQVQLLGHPMVKQIDNETAFVPNEEFEIRFQNIHMENCWMEFAHACPSGTRLVMLAMSSRGGFEKRMGTRETWLKDSVPGEVHRFLIADPMEGETEDVQQKLEAEQKAHGDIVFLHGFEDKYKHLHLKWYGGLVWQLRYCAGAEWVMKVDDDSTVHLRRMAHWIEHKFRPITIDHPLAYFGYATSIEKPYRSKESKWYVPSEVFPHEFYPPFVFGASYLATGATIKAIMAHTAEAVAFFLDDVVFTGILAKLANVTVSDQREHFWWPLVSVGQFWHSKKMKCVDGVPALFSVWDAKDGKEMAQNYDQLKQLSCKSKRNSPNT